MTTRNIFKKTTLAITLGMTLGLYGCGGSGSNLSGGQQGGSILTGVFIDAPVKGLKYKTASQTGISNEKGEFSYKANETITFSVDGLDIGTVKAAAEVPVTSLPHSLDVARLLQSLDIDPAESLIDITGIKIPTSLQTAFSNLLTNNQGDFDTVFTQTQLDGIESGSQVQLVNATPVTEANAIQHITGSISENFTLADFTKQLYVLKDQNTALSFFTGGTGVEFSADTEGASESFENRTFTWSIINNDVTLNFTDGDTVSMGLISVDDNQYAISVAEGSETSLATLHKAKSLTVASLNGKTLTLDTSEDTDCSSRTIKFTNNAALLKESCTSGNSESNLAIVDDQTINNQVYAIFTDGASVGSSISFSLINGTLDKGTFTLIHKTNDSFTRIDLTDFEK